MYIYIYIYIYIHNARLVEEERGLLIPSCHREAGNPRP